MSKDRYRPTKTSETVITTSNGQTVKSSGVSEVSGGDPDDVEVVIQPSDPEAQEQERHAPHNLRIEATQFVFSDDRRHLVNVILGWDEVPEALYYEVRIAAL